MEKQTAVDWIKNKCLTSLDIEPIIRTEQEIGYSKALKHIIQIIDEQARQMEKEQLKDAHIEGQRVFDKHDHTQWTNDKAEQYYNETYGGNKFQFEIKTTTSSATKCKWCGKEKWQHGDNK